MARYWQSSFRSFANGMMLASLPVIGFLIVDHLVATPTETPAETAALPVSGAQFEAQKATTGPEIERATPVQPSSSERLASAPASSHDAKQSLAASIQRELKRVGCFAGEADGSWSERTRTAMRAFNSSVHVTLTTDKPDYILLTLLQGHSARACWRSCEGTQGHADQCIDRPIEARGPEAPATQKATGSALADAQPAPPKLTAKQPLPAAGSWSKTVVIGAPAATAESPARPDAQGTVQSVATAVPRAVLPPIAAVPPAGRGFAVETSENVYVDRTAVGEPRMGLGLLPPKPVAVDAVASEDPNSDVPAPQSRQAAKTRASAQPSERARPVVAPRNSGSVRNHFSEISRFAP